MLRAELEKHVRAIAALQAEHDANVARAMALFAELNSLSPKESEAVYAGTPAILRGRAEFLVNGQAGSPQWKLDARRCCIEAFSEWMLANGLGGYEPGL